MQPRATRTKRTATRSLRQTVGNSEGNAIVMIAVSIVALFSFAIIAIDGAIMMTTKTQLQNAADAAALAGASALPGGDEIEIRQRAKDYAGLNRAVQEAMAPVIIQDADVEINFTDAWVRVTTHRTAATGDPLRTYFLRVADFLRVNTSDVTAVAKAELQPLCGASCIKPWAIPDRWDDADNDEEYDQGETYADSNGNRRYDLGEIFDDDNGNGVWDAPEYYDPVDTGYNSPDDTGTLLVLKFGNPQDSIEPGHFFPIDLPPLGGDISPYTGADRYEEWIANCAPFNVEPGDSLQLEPGNMVGPTNHGVDALVDLDPNAWWDENTNTVRDSDFGFSPRIVLVPFFDPARPPVSGRNDVHVTKIGAFFIERRDQGGNNSEVVGRFIQVGVTGTGCAPGQIPSGFITGLALIE